MAVGAESVQHAKSALFCTNMYRVQHIHAVLAVGGGPPVGAAVGDADGEVRIEA